MAVDAAVTKGTIDVAAEEASLNALIIELTFKEIILSGLGASMKTLSMMTILNRVGQSAATCHNLDSCNT